MVVLVHNPRSVGSQAALPIQNDCFFSWSWFLQSLNSNSMPMDRVPSSSSPTFSSSECENSSDESASSPSSSATESEISFDESQSESHLIGFNVWKDYVPDKTEMKKVFEKFDENKDGKICGKDLHRFMCRLVADMSLEEAKIMLKSADHNSDGCVDFEEFYSLYLSLSGDDGGAKNEFEAEEEEEEDDTLLQVFQVFDSNGDGVITPQELQDVLNQLGFPEGQDISNCKQMIQRVDSNGDELIDITEFKSMMHSSCFQK